MPCANREDYFTFCIAFLSASDIEVSRIACIGFTSLAMGYFKLPPDRRLLIGIAGHQGTGSS
jgi:hypothetical protein